MKHASPLPGAARRAEGAFTMVEIVLSLAIIAIALVAIIGVLPLGLNVQTDNQEESIISADAAIWMEAIRGGAQGMEYLPKYVQEIRISSATRNMNDFTLGPATTIYTNYAHASNLIGTLNLPKYVMDYTQNPPGGARLERQIYADVRALNGNMADLAADADFAFKYRMFAELVPMQHVLTNGAPNEVNIPLQLMTTNLYELRLTFRWPLVIGTGGDYRAQTSFQKSLTFRTLVSGSVVTNGLEDGLHFMTPRLYTYQLVSTNTP